MASQKAFPSIAFHFWITSWYDESYGYLSPTISSMDHLALVGETLAESFYALSRKPGENQRLLSPLVSSMDHLALVGETLVESLFL